MSLTACGLPDRAIVEWWNGEELLHGQSCPLVEGEPYLLEAPTEATHYRWAAGVAGTSDTIETSGGLQAIPSVATPTPEPTVEPSQTPTPTSTQALQAPDPREVIRLTNAARAEGGHTCRGEWILDGDEITFPSNPNPALAENAVLMASAQAHAVYLANLDPDTGGMSYEELSRTMHQSGEALQALNDEVGALVFEVVARVPEPTAQRLVGAWLASKRGHCVGLLDFSHDIIGAGTAISATGWVYGVQLFANLPPGTPSVGGG